MTLDEESDIYRQRTVALKNLLSKLKLDAILLFSTRNDSRYSRWIQGVGCYSAFHYYFVTANRSGFLEISYRAFDLRAQTTEEVVEVEEEVTAPHSLKLLLEGSKRIGLAGSAPYLHLSQLQCEIVDVSAVLEPLMCLKSEAEIKKITICAQALSRAFTRVASLIERGIKESELSSKLRTFLAEEGEGLPFPISIVSGTRLKDSTVSLPTERRLEDEEILCIDAGLIKEGSYSDCTRMFFLGVTPAQDQYLALKEAHMAVLKSLAPGMKVEVIPELYFKELRKRHLPEESLDVKNLGHGIGLSLHEAPFICMPEYREFVLEPGMIFTLEPEIVFSSYRLRVEDMIYLSKSGITKLTP